MEIDFCCCFLLIPSSYICNTEKVKEYINSIGWYISIIDRYRTNVIESSINENIEMGAVSRPRLARQGENDRFQVVSKPSQRLIRTKSLPDFKYGSKLEHRKRSLKVYSETMFDLSIY